MLLFVLGLFLVVFCILVRADARTAKGRKVLFAQLFTVITLAGVLAKITTGEWWVLGILSVYIAWVGVALVTSPVVSSPHDTST